MENDTAHPLVHRIDHPHLQAFRRLDTRRARDQSRLAAIEGVRHVLLAEKRPGRIASLIVSPRLLKSREGRGVVARCEADGVPVTRVTPEVFRQLSRAPRASGVAALVRQTWTPLERLSPATPSVWLGVRRFDSSGNLGTALRTAWAVGAEGLVCLGRDTDPYDPAVLRASMGAGLLLQLVRTSVDRLARFVAGRPGWSVIGTSARASATLGALDRPAHVIVLVGNERKGLSARELALCDRVVRLPLTRPEMSVNAGVAASLALYELARGRGVTSLAARDRPR